MPFVIMILQLVYLGTAFADFATTHGDHAQKPIARSYKSLLYGTIDYQDMVKPRHTLGDES